MNQPTTTTTEKTVSNDHVLKTPIWMTVLRGLQVFFSIVVLALAARLMHDAYLDEWGLALAIALITWFVVAYILVTEKVRAAHSAYHIIAVIVLDGVMMVLWLAAWAAAAAKRAQFKVYVETYNCVDDGSIFDSKSCLFKRDDNVVLFKSGLAIFAALAGVGALVWLLFIATFVWTLIKFLHGRKEGRFAVNMGSTSTTTPAAAENYQMESKPFEPNQVQQQHNQQAQYPVQPQQTGDYQQNPQQQYNSGAPHPPQGQYQQAVSPQQDQGPYSPPQQQYQQQQQGYPQQQYQPQTSPSPYASEVGTTGHASPPPQELGPQSYQHGPQELPHASYPTQQQQQ